MNTGSFGAVFCLSLQLAILSVFNDIDKWACIYITHRESCVISNCVSNIGLFGTNEKLMYQALCWCNKLSFMIIKATAC